MKTTQEIAAFVGGTLKGQADLKIHTVGSLERAIPGALAYAEEARLDQVVSTEASCVLVPSGDFGSHTVIEVDNPRLVYFGGRASRSQPSKRNSSDSTPVGVLRPWKRPTSDEPIEMEVRQKERS